MRVLLFVLATVVLLFSAQTSTAQLEKEANGKAVGVAPVEHGTGAKDKIKDLQKQKLAKATALYPDVIAQWKAGVAAFNEVAAASTGLLKAGLDLCENKEERIKVLEESVKLTEQIVQTAKKRFEVGVPNAGKSELLRAEILLLEAQIALEKAKLAK